MTAPLPRPHVGRDSNRTLIDRNTGESLIETTAGIPGRCLVIVKDTIRYDMRCYFNVRSKANMSQLNLPHGTDNQKV